MAIVMMTSREDYEAHLGDPNYWIVHDYWGAEAGLVRHSRLCPHYAGCSLRPGEEIASGPRSDCLVTHEQVEAARVATGCTAYESPCYGPFEPLYMARTHVGLVLELGERNGYDDSDFYAVVWDPAKGAIDSIEYASTRGWSYPNSAAVDATPEVVAAYTAWRDARDAAARAAYEAQQAEEAKVRAAKAAKLEEQRQTAEALRGKAVRVRRATAKISRGTTGVLFYVGPNRFGEGFRVGFKDASGTAYWTTAGNIVAEDM
jgi:hypothetical protein